MDLTAFKQEITKWRHHWSIGPPDDPLPETLVETLDQTSAGFYEGIYVAVTTLLTFPISACAVECSFSSMKRLKTSLRNTMTDERLSSLAILHIHNFDKDANVDNVAKFAHQKERRQKMV